MQDIIYQGHHDKDNNLHTHVSAGTVCPRHFHRNFEMQYILDGEMLGEVNGTEFKATKDDIVFISNYYVHSFDCKMQRHKCMIIPANISADFASRFKKQTLPIVLGDKEFNKTILELLEKDELTNSSYLVKKGYVLLIIGKLLEHYPTVKTEINPDIEVIVNILNYIDENYSQDLTLDSISAAFGYNKYYFSKMFNRYVKENLTSYINIVRIQNMLKKASKNSKPNIAELAFENGFDSLATFYRCFNKMYGMSPTEYLNTKKENTMDLLKYK